MSVLIETTLGDIVVDLFCKERPNCSLNFLKLCKTKYYNLCQFHRIEKDYVAQTGDPTGTGRGGESIFGIMYGDQARYFEKEAVPKLRHTRKGIVSFVDGGNGMLGSQFFITLSDEGIDYLDDKHTIFGQVTEGDETLDALNAQICDDEHSPFRDIRITHTIVLHDPFDDPKLMQRPRRSPSPTMEQLMIVNKIPLDEKENEDDGKDAAEIEEEMKNKEAVAQAQILEMVGDLHHADEKPEDNVLFVCKLNPVTTDEDLEIIFSRFGTIKCCEIIKDRRTQTSLQYAFIEFETPGACEQAFFKMDNVLIDDRRIHVDFSQSVAKNGFTWSKNEGGAGGRGRNGRDGREVQRREEPRREKRRDDHGERRREEEQETKRRRSRSPQRDRRDDRERDRRKDERKRSRSRERRRSPSRERRDRRERSRSRDRKKDRR